MDYLALPMILKPKDVQLVLGLRINDVYKLFRSKRFPSEKVGGRYIIPKPRFLKWLGEEGCSSDKGNQAQQSA